MEKINTISFLYCIKNKKTQRSYVGITEDPRRRFRDHLRDLSRGTHENSHMQEEWEPACFEVSVLEVLINKSGDQTADRERYWIKELNSFKQGYNLTQGGEGTNERKRLSAINAFAAKELVEKNGLSVSSVARFLSVSEISIRRALKGAHTGAIEDMSTKDREKALTLIDEGRKLSQNRVNLKREPANKAAFLKVLVLRELFPGKIKEGFCKEHLNISSSALSRFTRGATHHDVYALFESMSEEEKELLFEDVLKETPEIANMVETTFSEKTLKNRSVDKKIVFMVIAVRNSIAKSGATIDRALEKSDSWSSRVASGERFADWHKEFYSLNADEQEIVLEEGLTFFNLR